MAEKDNTFQNTVEALFRGMDSFITTKTVVGEAIHIEDTIQTIKEGLIWHQKTTTFRVQ